MKLYENGIWYYTKESDAAEAFAVRTPAGYDKSKSYPLWIIIHGRGELSDGTLDNLRNVMTGFDFDGDGPRGREDAVLYPAFRTEADKRGHILVVVTYKTSFQPNDFDYVLNTCEADFSVDRTRVGAIAFSLGGGELLKEITYSSVAARRFNLAVLAAPVNPGGNYQYIADARLQVIGISYAVDKTVSSSNIKNIITGINAKNPQIKPVYIELPGEAHGGLWEIQEGTAAVIPQHIMAYMDSTSTADRRQYPTTVTKPTEPVPTQPAGTLTADFNVSADLLVTATSFELDASVSKGVKAGSDGYVWDVVPVSGPWTIKVAGGAWGGPKKLLTGLGNGTYDITLTTKDSAGKTAKKTVRMRVKVGDIPPTPKTVQGFADNLITFSDGTTEAGKATYSAGRWVIVAASGKYEV